MLAKKCNDMDTASLLIALLRASDIPARYVHGVIELQIDKVMNWVGGFTDMNSAVGFIASGGTPVLAINQGGSIANVQMEHVWVEAYVDYIPSRGAVHITGDNWVPLDGSYKQYVYTKPVDIATSIGFDSEEFVANLINGSTTHPDGSISQIPESQIVDKYNLIINELKGSLDAGGGNVNVTPLFGSKKVIPSNTPHLPMGFTGGARIPMVKFPSLPDQNKWFVEFSAKTEKFTIDPELKYSVPTAEVAGKDITLIFAPTGSDEDLLVQGYGTVPRQLNWHSWFDLAKVHLT